MRNTLAASLFVFASTAAFAGSRFMWPDASVIVPPLVHDFIVAECADFNRSTDEEFDDCVEGERLGYRATVMMLSNPEIGEAAAERYRVCRAGLGSHGGRFHRRRAECIGHSFQIHWRFETTRRASISVTDTEIRTAASGARWE